MENLFENIKENNDKEKLWLNIFQKHIKKFSWLVWLFLSMNANAIENYKPDFDNLEDIQRYEQIKDEFLIYNYWLTKTLQDKNPNTLLSKKLISSEKKILKASRINIEKWKLYFWLDLTKANINGIKSLIDSLVYLMDITYWEWYSSILTDWLDHSDKKLIIDIKEYNWEYKIRKISIEENKKIDNDKKIQKISSLA